ncbi:hypothetical protein AQUCO_07400031v1 [Aquilegia coerulea]|uniref:non-specific serine/threonine protein kinase n=1 Tax=Aquilegia coerulea TaxID=218851 RepID=A0A2G5C9E4_AQUCA|nr:hypothetical protein AQUCO_07400031v1 [Aquilegia coerulea]
MGNCLRKKAAEDTEPVGIAGPCNDPPVQTLNKISRGLPSYGLNIFPYSVLKTATQKFSRQNLIGQGGFGDVYRGWIDSCTINATKPGSGRAIAVKKLRKEGLQGHNEWLNELVFLSQFNHPNIVKIIGYCSEGHERILVYEYMARGNLEAYLIRENGYGLSWSRRLQIAIGAARGLAYLHNSRNPVIHRDLKASNVLLDSELNPKLSDFGLAKYGPQGDKSHVSTRILGTRGYFAPEYVATGHLTIRTDVYSFGVVLLEIFCGCGAIRKHTDGMAGDLTAWATPYLSNKLQLSHVIDRKLHKNLCMEQAVEFANIILRCLNHDPKSRPTMNEVVIALEQLSIPRQCYTSSV